MSDKIAADRLDKPEAPRGGVELFADGFVDSLKKPLQGLAQLTGHGVVPELELSSSAGDPAASKSWAHSAGEMVGQATMFYAAATVLRNVPKCGLVAPIAAGGALGFLEPAKDNNLYEHFGNAVRGATTMAIMERMPASLATRGFRGDLIGNTLNVFYTGAVAGAVDTNMQSLLTDHKVASLQTTATAAISWGVTGSAFHLGSLYLSKGFRSITENQSTELLLLGPQHGESGYKTRDFLNSLSPFGVKYRQIDITKQPFSGMVDGKKLPLVMFPDGSTVDGANTPALAKKLNLHTSADNSHYRVVVVGAGPGGVQTAINAASEFPVGTEKVAVIGDVLGGQARYTSSVKNYMGFPDVTGAELMTQGIAQAKARGAEFIINRVQRIEPLPDGTKDVLLKDGSKVNCDAVVLATGMTYHQLDAPGMERLAMKGVYTLADAHEAPQLKGQRVFLVGAGNSAGQAAINFSRYAKEVNMLVRGKSLESSMSQYLIDEIRTKPNIKVHLNSQVAAVDGVNNLETVTVNTKGESGQTTRQMGADAMYVYIGGKPNTAFLDGGPVKLDSRGFVLTGHSLHHHVSDFAPGLGLQAVEGKPVADISLDQYKTLGREPLEYETSMPGVFAVGDVRSGNPQKRIMSATGDAGKAIGNLHEYLPGIPISETVPLTSPAPQRRKLFDFSIKLPSLTASLLGGQLDDSRAVFAH